MIRTTAFCVAAAITVPVAAEQSCDASNYALSSPSERFIDNDDGTVTDRVTQLMWMRCSQGQRWAGGGCVGNPSTYEWSGANAAAERVNDEGDAFFSDWRLPSLTEIAAIVERQCSPTRINLSVFPDTPPELYWSSSSRPKDQDLIYVMGFGGQGVAPVRKDEAHYVRLVRTGP